MSHFISYEKSKDSKAILAEIDNRIEIKKESLYLIDAICTVAKKWNGKKINKRFATDVQKIIGEQGYIAHYRPQYGMFHIDIDYKSTKACTFSSLLCYDNDPVIDFNQVKGYNVCYTLNQTRITKLTVGKAHVSEMVDKWNAAVTALKEINKQASNFELEHTFELDRDR